MTRTIKAGLIILTAIFIASLGYAEENAWEKEYVHALQKGKLNQTQGGGLGYTQTEDEILADAIKKAIEMKAPPCEAMKIAVDLNYPAFSVIISIFASGGEVDLNQMCMCATEKGVTKQVIAQAARQAQINGQAVYPPDEVTQAQCLREGLGFTEAAEFPEDIPPGPTPNPVSVSSPSSGA